MTTTAEGVSERATLAKIAWRLLPVIAICYGIAYIDRVNISFAALQMNRDLGFSATVYGLGGGLFFLSYALLEVPSNMILQRVGARRWIARIMLTWGVISAGMMFVTTPWQFYVMRLLLGAAEAGFFPGVLYYVTLWFPESERGRAITRFYFAVPLGAAAMGAMAGALLDLQGTLGLAGWQWLFLVQGAPAILMAVIFIFAMPDKPADARWLSDAEKTWLARRLEAEAEGREGGAHHPFRALLMPGVLALSVVLFLALGSSYAFNLSAPAILRDATGLPTTQVGYITGAAGLGGAALMLLSGWLSDRTGWRYAFVVGPFVAAAAGLTLIALSDAPIAIVVGYLAFAIGLYVAMGLFWTTPGAILHPRAVAVSVAAMNSFGQLGSFILPALWGRSKDLTGSYHLGVVVLAVNYVAVVAILLILRARAKTVALPAS